MEIYWLGHGSFRLKGRDATVVTDPASPATGYKIGKVAADIVTLSRELPETSNLQAVTGEPKVLRGPGEYEIGGVLITAVRTEHGKREDRNMAYVIDVDDVRICHLGSIAEVPHADDTEALSATDVLLIPVGGGSVFNATQAAETVSLLEPKLVIPMIYKTEAAAGQLDTVEKFFKEMGAEPRPPEARLNITRSTVPHDRTIALLNYRG